MTACMEAAINAEGLSMEGLGSVGSCVSRDSRPPRERRIKKKDNAAAATMKSTSVTAAAAQPSDNDGACRYASHQAVRITPAKSHMSERPVPIECGGAKEHYQHRSCAEKSSKGQLEIATLAPDGDHRDADDAAEQ